MNKSDLKPACVFEQFAKINAIPRPSKHEEKMIEYLKNFGESHGLETEVDETGNVIIRKPATKGYENKKTVILQSHMDMVCEPSDGSFDFEHNPIETIVEGEWMRANGTTLGADDGIGVDDDIVADFHSRIYFHSRINDASAAYLDSLADIDLFVYFREIAHFCLFAYEAAVAHIDFFANLG